MKRTLLDHKCRDSYPGPFPIIGIITISGDVTLTVDSDLNGPSPQFTLTCISTGGPATTVTWTRDSEEAEGEAETVLINSNTAEYNHTLTVTGRLPGVYRFTVANDVPSEDSDSLWVQGRSRVVYNIIIQCTCILIRCYTQLPQLPLT